MGRPNSPEQGPHDHAEAEARDSAGSNCIRRQGLGLWFLGARHRAHDVHQDKIHAEPAPEAGLGRNRPLARQANTPSPLPRH